jgi:hypothetical protein
MAFSARFPMVQTQLLSQLAAPRTQRQQSGQPFGLIADRVVATPRDGATFTSEGVTVVISLSQQDPSAIIQLLNNAGIPCTIDRNGLLVLLKTNVMPTSNDPNLIAAMGFSRGLELREIDGQGTPTGGYGKELREDKVFGVSPTSAGKELRDN